MEKGAYQCRNFGKNCEYARKRTKLACEDGARLTVGGKEFKCPVTHPTCQHELRKTGGGNGRGIGKKWLLIGGVSLLVALALWLGWPSSRPQSVAVVIALSAPGGFERELQLVSSNGVQRVAVKTGQNGGEASYPNNEKNAKRLRIRHSLRDTPEVVFTRINNGAWMEHRFGPSKNKNVPLLPPVRRKVRVPIQAANTNLTIELETEQIISNVRVRLNSGVEQAVQNRDIEVTSFTLPQSSTPEDLYEVVTQINESAPQVHRFANYNNRRLVVWVNGVDAAIIAAERTAIALLARESKLKDDPAVLNGFKFWTNKYVMDLRMLPVFDDEESRASANNQLADRYRKADRSQLLELMMPLLGQHLSQLRSSGTIPTNFTEDILRTYKSHPNFLSESKK